MPDQVLRDEILNDPSSKGYAGKTHQQIADLLNAKNNFITKQKTNGERALWEMVKTGSWGAMLGLLDNLTTPVATRRAALGLRDVLQNCKWLDTDEPAELAALGGVLSLLVAAGAMTNEQRAAVLDLSNMYMTRASMIGYGPINAPQVADALSEPAP